MAETEVVEEKTDVITEETKEVELQSLDSAELKELINREDEPVKEDTPVKEEEAKPAETTKVEEPVKPDDITVLKTQVEKLEKRLKDKDDFINRRNAEIGELRKKATLNREVLSEKIFTDPVGAFQDMQVANDAQKEISRIETSQFIDINKKAVLDAMPNFETLKDTIFEIAKEDGLPEQNLAAFKENLYAEPAEVLYILGKRAEQRIAINARDKELSDLRNKIKELEGKPDALLQKIEKASNSNSLTGKSGGAGNSKDVVLNKPLHQLSQAELRKIIDGG